MITDLESGLNKTCLEALKRLNLHLIHLRDAITCVVNQEQDKIDHCKKESSEIKKLTQVLNENVKGK